MYSCVINCPSNACNTKIIVTYRHVVVLQCDITSAPVFRRAMQVWTLLICPDVIVIRVLDRESITLIVPKNEICTNIAGHSLTLQVDAEGVRLQGQPLVFALTYTGKKNEL